MQNKYGVSRETNERLEQYISLLIKWNKTINLVSSSTISDLESRHIIDSIQLKNHINNLESRIIDLGTGAGLPGVILSIIGFKNVTLIESDGRKVAFLRQAKKLIPEECSLNIINERVEKIPDLSCDILVSRAFSSLQGIFEYSKDIEVKEKYLLHKGENYQQEMASAEKDWLFNTVIHDSLTSSKGKILEISNLKAK